ncbi:hypothetical protein ACLOJK_010184 [Asimina triloba]
MSRVSPFHMLINPGPQGYKHFGSWEKVENFTRKVVKLVNASSRGLYFKDIMRFAFSLHSSVDHLDLAMGFQRMRGLQHKMEPLSKASCDRSDGWLGLPMAEDPTNLHLTSESGLDLEPVVDDNADAAYASWTMKYPSALTMFDRMMSAAKGKRVVVFLDYDGTLSPIVADPDQAFMSDAVIISYLCTLGRSE